jgi:HPt (histidine-containing phosphotransfer) domain-containing protein
MTPEKLIKPARQGVPREVVEKYLRRRRESLPGLRAAIGGNQFEYSRVFGHHLKGTGAAYGFPKLTEIGRSIENAALARDSRGLAKLAVVFEDYLEKAAVPGD